jgi:predicted transcriptional regulator
VNSSEDQWTPVIARSLALIAMKVADLDKKSISDRAAFLSTLGMPKEEIAPLLGSTSASIAELLRQRSKKGDSNGQPQKNSRGKSSKQTTNKK